MAKKSARLSPERLAATIIEEDFPLSLENWLEDNCAQWEELEKAVQEREWESAPSEDDLLALYERIAADLPEKRRKDLRDYSDGEGLHAAIIREAGFILGVSVGLRLAGGVR